MKFKTKEISPIRLLVYALIVAIILIIMMGDLTCTINLKDSVTKKYVVDPNIQASTGLTQIAAPGTGGAGPMIYSVSFPRFASIIAKTSGYKEKNVRLFLFPGMSYDIMLERE
ncbi:MAG: hypothetical protein RO469_00980 [Thermincola sp.]|jgi:hypothetical protein|nr:hypothetical protein [Thermincola sp.]MDT3701555.1 hypothetical protein [Thermincola sp.]